jgi:formate hydrogenlyase subunit 6/NADH:ubiquinone oxidoreductase subunit I
MTKGISVDQNLCTKCNICPVVCPMGIISPSDEAQLPATAKGKEPFRIECGHCEATCPPGALTPGQRARGEACGGEYLHH